jgi:hypothetical protein
VALVLNLLGKTGRQVEKGTAQDGTKYKQVTKVSQLDHIQKYNTNDYFNIQFS